MTKITSINYLAHIKNINKAVVILAQAVKEYQLLGLKPVHCRKCNSNRNPIGYKKPGAVEKKQTESFEIALWCKVCRKFTFF